MLGSHHILLRKLSRSFDMNVIFVSVTKNYNLSSKQLYKKLFNFSARTPHKVSSKVVDSGYLISAGFAPH
jgi:hypothetical protein